MEGFHRRLGLFLLGLLLVLGLYSPVATVSALAETVPPALSYVVSPTATWTNGNVPFTVSATDTASVQNGYRKRAGDEAHTSGSPCCQFTLTQNIPVSFSVGRAGNSPTTLSVSVCSIGKDTPSFGVGTVMAMELGGARINGSVAGFYDPSFTFPGASDPASPYVGVTGRLGSGPALRLAAPSM